MLSMAGTHASQKFQAAAEMLESVSVFPCLGSTGLLLPALMEAWRVAARCCERLGLLSVTFQACLCVCPRCSVEFHVAGALPVPGHIAELGRL